jgi:hypothetical protein
MNNVRETETDKIKSARLVTLWTREDVDVEIRTDDRRRAAAAAAAVAVVVVVVMLFELSGEEVTAF